MQLLMNNVRNEYRNLTGSGIQIMVDGLELAAH